jgi:PAS domain S-box-containing protein
VGDAGSERSRNEVSDHALRAAIDAASDGVLLVDDEGSIAFVNPMLLRLFGYEASELLGCPVEILIPQAVRDEHIAHRHSYMGHPRTRPMGSGLDLRGRHKDGHEFPVEIGLSPVPATGHERPVVIAIIRDVTERRHAAEELMRAQEQLALVDDRERIARDLHDTVIQRLFAVGLSLQGALARSPSPDMAERIDLSIDEIDGTIRDIRTAIFALQSRRGVSSGPRETVIQLAREAARAIGFEPHVEFNGLVDTAMTDAVREQFIPTVREALTNVAKHSRATRVAITVDVDDDVCLRVVDNGVGLADRSTNGNGLANIAERAAALGGSCVVKPADGGGTVLEWRVPAHSELD